MKFWLGQLTLIVVLYTLMCALPSPDRWIVGVSVGLAAAWGKYCGENE